MRQASPMEDLRRKVKVSNSPHFLKQINAIVEENKGYLWLPVSHYLGYWTAIIDSNSGELVKFLGIDPY